MNNSFNVIEFNEIINNIKTKSNSVEESLKKISLNIENLKNIIGNQDNSSLYQAWDDLKIHLDKVSQKYSQRKEEFISELKNYEKLVLSNNDEVYQYIQRSIEYIDSIANQIDSL